MVREQLKFLMESEDRNTVFWLERRSGRQMSTQSAGHADRRFGSAEDLLFENYPGSADVGDADGAGWVLAYRKRLGWTRRGS